MQRLALPSGANLTPDDCYAIDVVPQLCGEGGIVFGGWAMAVMVEVAQAWSGRRVRTLAASFVAPDRVGDELRITVTPLRSGRQLAHCRIDGQVGGIPVLSAAAVVGPAAAAVAGAPGTAQPRGWAGAPDAPPPELCPERTYRSRTPDSAAGLLDLRLAAPEPQPDADSGGPRCPRRRPLRRAPPLA